MKHTPKKTVGVFHDDKTILLTPAIWWIEAHSKEDCRSFSRRQDHFPDTRKMVLTGFSDKERNRVIAMVSYAYYTVAQKCKPGTDEIYLARDHALTKIFIDGLQISGYGKQ